MIEKACCFYNTIQCHTVLCFLVLEKILINTEMKVPYLCQPFFLSDSFCSFSSNRWVLLTGMHSIQNTAFYFHKAIMLQIIFNPEYHFITMFTRAVYLKKKIISLKSRIHSRPALRTYMPIKQRSTGEESRETFMPFFSEKGKCSY